MYFITYVDRVNISTAAPAIKDEFGLSNTELGLIFSAFASRRSNSHDRALAIVPQPWRPMNQK